MHLNHSVFAVSGREWRKRETASQANRDFKRECRETGKNRRATVYITSFLKV